MLKVCFDGNDDLYGHYGLIVEFNCMMADGARVNPDGIFVNNLYRRTNVSRSLFGSLRADFIVRDEEFGRTIYCNLSSINLNCGNSFESMYE